MLLLLLLSFMPMQTSGFYDFKVEAIDGTVVDFSQFRGKKLLIVNTASKCGYTRQYEDLQKLHEQYGDKLVVLGFPSNNFMGQEPGTNEEIASFCKVNFGVSFQMFAKMDVKGKNQHPLYQWLSSKESNGWNDKASSWNFCKYLIDEDGKLVQFYRSGTNPMDSKILDFVNG